MANCVNISHPDFKKLQKETNINSFELEMIVSNWQSKNNTDEFPTAEEILKINTKYDISLKNKTQAELEITKIITADNSSIQIIQKQLGSLPDNVITERQNQEIVDYAKNNFENRITIF